MATTPPRKSRIPLLHCNLARSIEQIGDRWSLLILRSAFYGLRRFGDFQTELNIPRTVLSGRLKKFVTHNILEIRPYREAGQRPRPEYFMTEKGADLAIAMIALNQWGDKWLSQSETPPLEFLHKDTNQPLIAALAKDQKSAVPLYNIKRQINLKD